MVRNDGREMGNFMHSPDNQDEYDEKSKDQGGDSGSNPRIRICSLPGIEGSFSPSNAPTLGYFILYLLISSCQ